MDRKSFLQKAGIILVAGPLALRGVLKGNASLEQLSTNCVLIPTQTGGPFYLDPDFNRVDIRENLAGLPLHLQLQVVGVQNCAPIPNAVVNIWHTDTHGGYSQFGQVFGNYDDFSNQTWLRGYQVTDANGECNFTTIFPGWYPGRAAHIHFDVHLGFTPGGTVDGVPDASSLFMGQMYFPDALVSQVYTQVAPYSTWGDSPTNQTNDSILLNTGQAGDLTVQMDTSDFPNSVAGTFCIGLDMAGTPVGMPSASADAAFSLSECYPNPAQSLMHIPFELHRKGQVSLGIFDAHGKVILPLLRQDLAPGTFTVDLDIEEAKLAPGIYFVDLIFHFGAEMERRTQKFQVLD